MCTLFLRYQLSPVINLILLDHGNTTARFALSWRSTASTISDEEEEDLFCEDERKRKEMSSYGMPCYCEEKKERFLLLGTGGRCLFAYLKGRDKQQKQVHVLSDIMYYYCIYTDSGEEKEKRYSSMVLVGGPP